MPSTLNDFILQYMRGRGARAWVCFFILLALLVPSSLLAQSGLPAPRNNSSAPPATEQKLTIAVTDETGVAVRSARVELQPAAPLAPIRCETDFAGRCEFVTSPHENYDLRVEKDGYYAVTQSSVRPDATPNIEVTLTHQREAHETVNVTAPTPEIDPAQVSTKEELSGVEVINIPYPGSHDYRNALLFIPGITPDSFGQAHVAGAETYQTLVLLDGFNVSQPTNGELLIRTSIESFRSIEITPSREPAEYGKGSGGVLALNTKMGDDHVRLTATDFTPSVQTTKGLSLSQWVPIVTFSGPLRKGKTWFIDALDGEYDNNIVPQLPSNADNDQIWRVDNLAKLQSNFTTRNIVTASFLLNYYHNLYDGLSVLQPQPTTPTDSETAYIGSLKDQYYFRGGELLESGFGVAQYDLTFTPQGTGPYIETTNGAAGNYYLHEGTLVRRLQWIANLNQPPQQFHGRHDIKVGADVDHLNYAAEFDREPISFLLPNLPAPDQVAQPCATGANGLPAFPSTCARYSTFTGGKYSTTYNSEASAYAEDRWLATHRLLIEPGLRFDWDQFVRWPAFSPRLAGTYVFDDEGNTKLSAGVGIVYDATSLGIVDQPFNGQRTDYFFNSSGNPTDVNGAPTNPPMLAPVPTAFFVNRNTLAVPRYLNWSIGLEKKLPHAVFLKLEFLEKRGSRGFAYNTLNGAVDGNFFLGNRRDDRYDAFQISARHRFHKYYEIFGAYTRSRSNTNEVFDFSLDIPLLSPQLPGPYPWDTPNRFLGWGIVPFFKLPILHKVDLVYSAEARTGLPFYATTDQGQIYPGYPPGTFRLPAYYTANVQLEKRFHFLGRYWALRGGFNDITNHANVVAANGVLDASHPLPTYIDGVGRAFTGRLRYLGKQ